MPSTHYRPDIDGLRAVAIILVVIYHAFPEKLTGGFIGVDVFFVISGYLISNIILENLNNNHFSFISFYSRRIRRIFPALIVILISSYVAGWCLLLADEFSQLGKHIAAGAAYIENFILWSEAGYFDIESELKPLMHLWSLSIEEQFYICYPFALWFLWKFQKRNILKWLIVIFSISLALSTYEAYTDRVTAFFFPHTRLWELLSGGILAYSQYINIHTDNTRHLKSSIHSIIGMFIIIISSILIIPQFPFPGVLAILPVAGTLMIIASGEKSYINKYILSRKEFVSIGLISYPLYLWHWPILSFFKILESWKLDFNLRLMAIILSIILSYLTYYFIEKPVKNKKQNKEIIKMLIYLMVIVLILGISTNLSQGYPHRSIEVINNTKDFSMPYRNSCATIIGEEYHDDWCNLTRLEEQPYGPIIIGDSFSNVYSGIFDEYEKKYHQKLSFLQFARGQCPSLIEYGPDYCRKITEKAINFIRDAPSVKKVILAADWPVYYSGKYYSWLTFQETHNNFILSFTKTIKTLRSLGKEPIVLLAFPKGANPRSCVLRPITLAKTNKCTFDIVSANEKDSDYRNWLIPYLENERITYFDPFQYLCNSETCTVSEGENVIYADTFGHLSKYGTIYMVNKASHELRVILD